jgi:hypothetical protein
MQFSFQLNTIYFIPVCWQSQYNKKNTPLALKKRGAKKRGFATPFIYSFHC